LLAVVLSVVTFYDAWTGWYEQKGFPAPAPPKTLGQDKEVVAFAWIDQSTVEEGARFRLWVLFENRSESAALGLRFLNFETPGFESVDCRASPPEVGPACRPRGAGQGNLLGLPGRLEQGRSLTVFTLLEARAERGPSGASGIFTWRDPGGAEHQGAVVLPAVPITSPGDRFWFSLGKVGLLLKDLLLPAALAYLGWYLQRRDKDRDEKLASEKDERAAQELDRELKAQDEKEKKAADERELERQRERRETAQTRLSETWNLMLPKSHANAEQHYMPVVAAIDNLLIALCKLGPHAEDEQWHALLWALLRVLRLMEHLSNSIGGFYFRNLKGEDLAATSWNLFHYRARERLGAADRARALLAIGLGRDDNYSSFLDRLAGRPAEASLRGWARAVLDPGTGETAEALARLETRLREWVGDRGLQRSLPLLALLREILAYEMNRPYELWYGERASLNEQAFWIALERLEPEFDANTPERRLEPKFDALPEQAMSYLESVRRDRKRALLTA
jgi:hypothetical protein